jgi:dipeptidyl aminopeptidase/acylaminoacyl peptidase
MVQRLGETPREVWRAPTTGQLNGFSPDGARLLFTQAESDTRQVLLEIDVRSGTPRRIWPTQGTATISEAAFTEDGRGILLAIERLGAPPRILLLDGSSLAVRAQLEKTRVPTGRVAFDVPRRPATGGGRHRRRQQDRGASPRCEDPRPDRGRARRRRGLQTHLSPRRTAVRTRPGHPVGPTGHRLGGRQDAGGDSAPGRPASGLRRRRHSDGAHRGDPGVRRSAPATQPLPPEGGREPEAADPGARPRRPFGSAYLLWKPVVAVWTSLGFAVVEPNIRGSTGFGIAWQDGDNKEKRADAMRDMESIHAWAKAQPWCDGKQIVVGGISYGGYMALLALTRQPTLWAGGIDGSGMSDLRTMERNEDQTVRVFDEDEFGTIGKDDAVLLEWSPLKDVGKVVAPLFVYQGVHDPVTPRSEADQVVSALRAHRVPVEYLVLESEGHGVVRKENVATYLARSYRFIAEHLGLE